MTKIKLGPLNIALGVALGIFLYEVSTMVGSNVINSITENIARWDKEQKIAKKWKEKLRARDDAVITADIAKEEEAKEITRSLIAQEARGRKLRLNYCHNFVGPRFNIKGSDPSLRKYRKTNLNMLSVSERLS